MKKFGLIVWSHCRQAVMFLVLAGRWDLPWCWAVLGIHEVFVWLMNSTLDSDLLRERFLPGPGARDPNLPKRLQMVYLAHYVVAALDIGRFHWSGSVPTPVHLAGLVGYTLGLGLMYWAMLTNRFFSIVVRLQKDRGHRVVTAGPYSLVRHPGYAGMIFGFACGAIAMGSWWSLASLAPSISCLIWRTRMEDRFLHEQLDGYCAYASQVRSRLLPGFW